MSNLLKQMITFIPTVFKEIGQWKSETEETRRQSIIADNDTKQAEIIANKETRKAELGSLDNTTNKIIEVTTNALDNSNNTVNRMAEVSSHAMDNNSELTKESIVGTNALSNKIIDNSKDMIEYINEDKKHITNSSKVHYDQLVEIHESKHKAQIETVYYRTREEILNEVSKNVLTYAQSRIYINEKIQNLESEIALKKKKIESDQKKLEELKHEFRVEESKYQDLNNDFNALINSIEKLAYEYKDSMEEKEYRKNIKREQRELQKYIDKIENIELKLLNKEKEKLIIDKKLQPKISEIEELKLSLEYLKSERNTNEFKGLLNLSNIQTNNLLIDNEIIEVEITDDKKVLTLESV